MSQVIVGFGDSDLITLDLSKPKIFVLNLPKRGDPDRHYHQCTEDRSVFLPLLCVLRINAVIPFTYYMT
jgi:hypothetical protein